MNLMKFNRQFKGITGFTFSVSEFAALIWRFVFHMVEIKAENYSTIQYLTNVVFLFCLAYY